MYARAIDEAQTQLLDLHQDEVQDAALAGVALSASLASTALCPPLAIPLFAGGLAMVVLGIRAIWRRWDLLDRLADDRDAYAIRQVREYAARDAGMRRRRHYADLARSYSSVESSLDELARELEDPTLELDPAAALACRRLLTDPTTSPLFDDPHGSEDLRSGIARIRAGFEPSA
jgi:hypothetical protein